MELKYVNLNGDNVVASNPNNIKPYFWKIVHIKLKTKKYIMFFVKHVVIA
jgi:hypothetical protein